MKCFGYFSALLATALLMSCCETVSKSLPQTFSIRGRAFDNASGNGIADATVALNPGARNVQTAADGSYSFDQLEAGTYLITVATASGYSPFAPSSREVRVGPTDAEGIDFSAAPQPAKPVEPGPWDFGNLIYRPPVDSTGHAHVLVESFAPDQQAAFVVINMNPLYLDAHNNADGSFPPLPDAGYSFATDLIDARASQASASNTNAVSHTQHLTPQSGYAIRSDRSAKLSRLANQPTKTTSLLQKGEVRTFSQVPQRTSQNPPIQPGADDPDRDLFGLSWPSLYNSQDGRLVAVGQHCLVFLSTEINAGHPDTVRVTQSRLNRMANEFDNNIFPIATAVFGPVRSYAESSIYRDLDRSLVLTGDDFDNDGNLTRDLPGGVDVHIGDENKMPIFIHNGAEGSFFTYWNSIDTGQVTEVGSTLYLASDNFPSDAEDFKAAFSLLAHEFQHKLYHDNGLPERATEYDWLSEGLSALSLYVCGYTPNSGKLIHWAIDSHLSEYIQHTNTSAVPMDANPYFSGDSQYGAGLLFFLYMFEHYDPGVGKRIYQAAISDGLSDRIELVERGAQYTVDGVTRQDSFEQLYAKFAITNFVDGINTDDQTWFDSRFHYDTIDLRGTVNLSTGATQLPGVNVSVFPNSGSYPVVENDRLLIPWGVDYIVFGGGDGRDLDVQFRADKNFRIFLLPVNVETDPSTGEHIRIDDGIELGY